MKEKFFKIGKNLMLEIGRKGFVLWAVESNGVKHWIIDGSTIKEDGEFTISLNCYKLGYEIFCEREFFNDESEHFVIKKVKKEVRKK